MRDFIRQAYNRPVAVLFFLIGAFPSFITGHYIVAPAMKVQLGAPVLFWTLLAIAYAFMGIVSCAFITVWA